MLCIGAHCDDIEIGCGATLLRLAGQRSLDVTWAITVLDGGSARAEARASARSPASRCAAPCVRIDALRDAYLPAQWAEAKDIFEAAEARAHGRILSSRTSATIATRIIASSVN